MFGRPVIASNVGGAEGTHSPRRGWAAVRGRGFAGAGRYDPARLHRGGYLGAVVERGATGAVTRDDGRFVHGDLRGTGTDGAAARIAGAASVGAGASGAGSAGDRMAAGRFGRARSGEFPGGVEPPGGAGADGGRGCAGANTGSGRLQERCRDRTSRGGSRRCDGSGQRRDIRASKPAVGRRAREIVAPQKPLGGVLPKRG